MAKLLASHVDFRGGESVPSEHGHSSLKANMVVLLIASQPLRNSHCQPMLFSLLGIRWVFNVNEASCRGHTGLLARCLQAGEAGGEQS